MPTFPQVLGIYFLFGARFRSSLFFSGLVNYVNGRSRKADASSGRREGGPRVALVGFKSNHMIQAGARGLT